MPGIETGIRENRRHDRSRAFFNYLVFSVTLCFCGEKPLVPHAIHERAQLPRTRWMTQFAQGLGFDLADAFARYRERLAYFFERVLAAVFQAEAHLDDFFLARSEEHT